MKTPALILAALATLPALLHPPQAQAAYLTQDSFNAALGADASRLVSLPAATSVTVTDSFGTRPASQASFEFSQTRSTPGTLVGDFGCAALVPGCSGAYSITYTFAQEVSALAGSLSYFFGTDRTPDALPFLEVQATSPLQSRYDGFWGKTFAPTTTLTIEWPRGEDFRDDRSAFFLTDAVALIGPPRFGGGIGPGSGVGPGGGAEQPVAVPEPSMLALLMAGLLGLLLVQRKPVQAQ